MRDVDWIAEKLAPMMPERIRRWRRSRELVDPEMRALLERQLKHLGQQVLGDSYDKFFLSLPPARLIAGEVSLGTVLYGKSRWSAGLSRGELLQNMVIVGRSGAGKTNVLFGLLMQLIERRIPFLLFDWKRTGRHLLPLAPQLCVLTPGREVAPFSFNPFLPPPGLEPDVYEEIVVDQLSRAYTLGSGAQYLLKKALVTCRSSDEETTLTKLLKTISAEPDFERVRGWKITLLRALESLSLARVIPTRSDQEKAARDLLGGYTILELDGLSPASRQFLVPLLALWLYYAKLASAKREELSFILAVEEAHHVLHQQQRSARESALEMLLRQCREIGIGMIIVDQHPHLLSSAVTGNCYTSICLNLKDPKDVMAAARLSLLHAEDHSLLTQLPVGDGIIKLQDRWRQPFMVRFPMLEGLRKGSISDAMLMARSLRGSAKSLNGVARTAEVPRFPRPVILSDKRVFAFLSDIHEYQQDGVKQRYGRLKLSAGTGNRSKEKLLKAGWIESAIIELGQTRKVVLRLTRKARELMEFTGENARESLPHTFWKLYYADLLKRHGYEVQIEGRRKDGRCDILAKKNGRTIVVEVETGSSNFLQNVKKALASRIDRILVVVTSDDKVASIEQDLARSGLLLKNRVTIVLRDKFDLDILHP